MLGNKLLKDYKTKKLNKPSVIIIIKVNNNEKDERNQR